jgi:hypothetical protein
MLKAGYAGMTTLSLRLFLDFLFAHSFDSCIGVLLTSFIEPSSSPSAPFSPIRQISLLLRSGWLFGQGSRNFRLGFRQHLSKFLPLDHFLLQKKVGQVIQNLPTLG